MSRSCIKLGKCAPKREFIELENHKYQFFNVLDELKLTKPLIPNVTEDVGKAYVCPFNFNHPMKEFIWSSHNK